jgi:thiol-disulfide isomerase/thioredoxin
MPLVGRAAGPTPVPAAVAPATQQSRTRELIGELQTTTAELNQSLNSTDILLDATKRAEAAPKVVPLIKRLLSVVTELSTVEPRFAPRADQFRIRALAILSLLDDAPTQADLKKSAEGTDQSQAIAARSSLLLADWWRNGKDAAAQGKAIDGVKALARENPEDDRITSVAMQMIESGAASPELQSRAEHVVIDDLKGPGARQVGERIRGLAQLRALENKPLIVAGPTITGEKLTTADWKGKVILVDFWATWCGPCLGELPRVQKAYADYHDKGLEVLGVSCDQEAEALRTFLMQNKDISWPQLFDVTKPGWHELATSYGIQSIPTMLLIDKKGIVRTVNARQNFEELIPKMLEEKAE